jgi:hypothetical protein
MKTKFIIFIILLSCSLSIFARDKLNIDLISRTGLISAFTEAINNPDDTELALEAIQALGVAVTSGVITGKTAIALVTIMNTNMDFMTGLMSVLAVLQTMPIEDYHIEAAKVYVN